MIRESSLPIERDTISGFSLVAPFADYRYNHNTRAVRKGLKISEIHLSAVYSIASVVYEMGRPEGYAE
jgi:hypothetical protein